MMLGDGMWAFVVVGGFVILAAVLAYAKLRNKAEGGDEPVQSDSPPPNYGETRGDD